MKTFGIFGMTAMAVLGFAGAAASAQADDGSYCREYQQRVTIGGAVHETYGTACMQQDGSWKIVGPDGGLSQPNAPIEIMQPAPQQQVVEHVVYEQPAYVPAPYIYPAVGLSFGFNDWGGGHGGGWHGGGGGWHH